MTPCCDVAVVGGGPAGLALAIAAARRGLSVTVLERKPLPVDKACGEGILPSGVRALECLDVLRRLREEVATPFREIRWVEADGTTARLTLPPPFGLGVRRVALSLALGDAAREAGAEVKESAPVLGHRRERDRIVAFGNFGEVVAQVLVGADGLHSRVREREGLTGRVAGGAKRFGLSCHYSVPPWAEAVEVHFARGLEAYVTPVGNRRVGLAFLFERGFRPEGQRASFDDFLARFPSLERRLKGVARESQIRGAGPLEQSARTRVADRLVLLGDAGGYVDALTGEGLSIALLCALDLARILPAALLEGAGRRTLAVYETLWRRRFVPYSLYTRTMLGLTRRAALRRTLVHLASARPAPFERLLAAAVG